MPPVKPYRSVLIRECGDPLIPVPRETFAFFDPHPYVALGAPYGSLSPWMLREKVLKSLQNAQKRLQTLKPGWRIMLFDAYRPNTVQAFMVQRELTKLAHEAGLNPANLTGDQRDSLLVKTYRVFAIPSDDPATPPPHSTGAVIDCTLADAQGREVDMGSPIDENSDRSFPDYFKDATEDAGKRGHANRILLNDIMGEEGFVRNPSEWWHFSTGDQLAVWATHGLQPDKVAIYGRADLLP